MSPNPKSFGNLSLRSIMEGSPKFPDCNMENIFKNYSKLAKLPSIKSHSEIENASELSSINIDTRLNKTVTKILRNKLGVLLRFRSLEEIMTFTSKRTPRAQFQKFIGSIKERCQRNLRAIEAFKKKLGEVDNDSEQQLRLALAVRFYSI